LKGLTTENVVLRTPATALPGASDKSRLWPYPTSIFIFTESDEKICKTDTNTS
jgi:hypothetical protein